jgi:hypothetical protein
MDDEWATLGAPDAQSAGHAARVIAGIRVRGMSPARYLMRRDGMSQCQAERLVAACHYLSWREYFSAKIRVIFQGE